MLLHQYIAEKVSDRDLLLISRIKEGLIKFIGEEKMDSLLSSVSKELVEFKSQIFSQKEKEKFLFNEIPYLSFGNKSLTEEQWDSLFHFKPKYSFAKKAFVFVCRKLRLEYIFINKISGLNLTPAIIPPKEFDKLVSFALISLME